MKNDMPEAKPASAFYRDHVKRVIDLIIAVPILILAAIPMAVVALAVKLDSPGPVLFKQDRLGKDGKVFKMLKFRSMCVGAEKTGSGVYSGKGDSRVTRVGKIIRATSLDELPQLLNIIKGELSVVGPRPVVKDELEKYTPTQRAQFLSVKPGLTGYWQAYARNNATYQSGERQEMELYYVHHASVWLDVKILCKTVITVLKREGAQ